MRALPTTVSCPAVIAFLRHVGCPFAEATLRALRDSANEHEDITFIAVSHADEAGTKHWADKTGGTGRVHVMSDSTRESYAAWGLGRTSVGHFMGRRSLREVS